MGYTTTFEGHFTLNKPLHPVHLAYLKRFAATRRMKRNADLAEKMVDDVRIAAELPIGAEGAYFVGSPDAHGQNKDESVVDYNQPPKGQPGLWCQWIPSDDGEQILWDGGEKFYEYESWIDYICTHFLEKWGYVLNGSVEWQGENPDDKGTLIVTDNEVSVQE